MATLPDNQHAGYQGFMVHARLQQLAIKIQQTIYNAPFLTSIQFNYSLSAMLMYK